MNIIYYILSIYILYVYLLNYIYSISVLDVCGFTIRKFKSLIVLQYYYFIENLFV